MQNLIYVYNKYSFTVNIGGVTNFSDFASRSFFGNQMCQVIHICDNHHTGNKNHICHSQTSAMEFFS